MKLCQTVEIIFRSGWSREFSQTAPIPSARSFHLSFRNGMPPKRSNPVSRQSGAKRAKSATEYAAATEPPLPEVTPLELLLNSLQKHHERIAPGTGNVVHWFRSDLRLEDNRALHAASEKAKQNGKTLIGLYVVS